MYSALDLFKLVATFYPIFIICFLLLYTIFNNTIQKWFVYLGGIFLIWFMLQVAARMSSKDGFTTLPAYCNLIASNIYIKQIPRPEPIIVWFTFTYLLIPMLNIVQPNSESNNVAPTLNIGLIVFLMMGAVITTILYGAETFCGKGNRWPAAVASVVAGVGWGFIWFFIFWGAEKSDLLFYNELGINNSICSRASEKVFVCGQFPTI